MIRFIVLAALAIVAGCTSLPETEWREETFRASTADGWQLSLRRYPPRARDRERAPVVLCHGLLANGRFWERHDSATPLARLLQQQGYDVWVCDLRGAGQTHRADPWSSFASPLVERVPSDKTYRWTLDTIVREDLPVILSRVSQVTGQPQVTWIGLDTGATAAVHYLMLNPNTQPFASIVALGAPFHWPQPRSRLLGALLSQPQWLTAWVEREDWDERPDLPAGLDPERVFAVDANLDDDAWDLYHRWMSESPTRGVMAQLNAASKRGALTSADGQRSLLDRLKTCRAAMLFVAGARDELAPPGSVRRAYEALDTPDKALVELSRSNGHAADYGHWDMVWAPTVTKDLYPVVLRWLKRH